jgi:Phage QLRG family, putative DNA packaging.
MALDSTIALVTLASVKTELSISGSSEDDYLEDLIEAASEEVQGFLNRRLPRATVTDEKHPSDGHPHLLLERTPVTTLTSVENDDTALDADNYDLVDAEAGWVQIHAGAIPSHGYRRSGIEQHPHRGLARWLTKVTYVGGYVTPVQSAEVGGDYEGEDITLPKNIRQATIETVTWMYRSQGKAGGTAGPITMEKIDEASVHYEKASTAFGFANTKSPLVGSLPLNARLKLARYRRIPVL